jgi:serine/threonine-protein kinase
MMLTPQGIVKLMDFGIARSSTDGSLTSTGTTLGSLNYMPPEQVRGESADARSDIYSFGVSLYEMLTGKLPFQGDSQYSLMTAHLNQTPPAPITLRSDLPAGLNEIIMMAIAKDPANRFQSADAFRAALGSVEVSQLPVSGTTMTATPKPSGATTLMDLPPAPRPSATPAPPRTPASSPAATPVLPTVPLTEPPSPAAARPSSSRGAWLALGAVLGVGVLITAAMYVPRHFGTHADPNKAMFPASGKSAATDTSTQGAADASTASNPVVSLQGAEGNVKVDANGNVSLEGPKGGVQINAEEGSVKISGKPGEPVAATPRAAANQNIASGNPTPSRATAPPEPAVPTGPSAEDIAKVEDEADKLNIRAATASQSVETLRKQQVAAGYNLRADIASSNERMQLYMSKGNAALQSQDLQNAEKYFAMADAELTKLEKFLGH